jgi:ATP-dependent exoDNAse (exonuclease V) alpha subunit
VRELILDVKYHSTQKPFAEGDRAVLHPRYTDYISHHILDRLAEIDALEDGDFLTLLRNSKALSSEITQPTQLIDAAMTEADKVGFTHSQLLAFKQCLHRRLTLVWGPPGTGKTHFLAQSICCLIAAKHRCQQTIRIAVTAFTHAAVENLLRELQEVITKQQTLDNTAVYKLGKIQTARGEDLKHIDEREAATIKFNGSVVLGGTVFGFRKATKQGLTPCDVLIIDEGSQLKLGETALVSKLLAPEGRWIIAGDDLQLPPIIQGIYPEAEDNLPGLHDSVFAYLRQRDDANTPYTCQLHENWRMNNTLSRFSAETLYGLSYRPANSAIAARKLRFGKQTHLIQTLSDSESEFLQWLLDPDWPLVVCILEDTKSAIENPLEAELIARLSAILRHQLLEDQNLYPHTAEGDRLFWRKALCIVSPHHLQIRAIQRALHNNHPWLSTPFVDTVDKMQGQQTEVVFVSYGVSDSETAFAEADFIYSLNRLNVSVTRARSKCLVCLPRPLLNSSFQLLSKKSATLGLGHMHALIEFCRRHGQQRQTHIHAASCAQNQSLVTAVRCHTLED